MDYGGEPVKPDAVKSPDIFTSSEYISHVVAAELNEHFFSPSFVLGSLPKVAAKWLAWSSLGWVFFFLPRISPLVDL